MSSACRTSVLYLASLLSCSQRASSFSLPSWPFYSAAPLDALAFHLVLQLCILLLHSLQLLLGVRQLSL
eukprot:6184652-Pleurochrysis_carterae.AAC.1